MLSLIQRGVRSIVSTGSASRMEPIVVGMGAQHLWQQLGTTKGSIRFMSKGKKTKKGGREGHIQHHHHPWDEPHEHGDVDDVVNFEKVKKNMSGGVVNFSRALSQMRPGKADAGVFDALHVTAYGQHVPLAQVAQVTVSGTHSLSVNIYDPALLNDIKSSIEKMNPCFSIRENASTLEVSFPKMTKETRAELLKAAKKQAEQARQHVRRVRQDAMNHVKKIKEEISEDEAKIKMDQIQKLTDETIEKIAKMLEVKEKDLNSV